MITIKDIAKSLEDWAPPLAAESYDNVGLLVGYPHLELSGVLLNLDMTEEVVLEAIKLGANMVIAHHPIWFTARKQLIGQDYISRAIMTAIKHDIALYACHTNLDNIRTGVNMRISAQLGLKNLTFLRPKPSNQEGGLYGSGQIGYLPQAISKQDFLHLVKDTFNCGGIRYADCKKEWIHKVAVCGGAGSFLTSDAIKQGADAFITADISYHKFFDNERKVLLLDIGHYESEQYTSNLICEYLLEKFPKFAVHLSKIKTNPVRYFS